jgi:hypothetical protein
VATPPAPAPAEKNWTPIIATELMSALPPKAAKWQTVSVRPLCADFVAKGVDGFREE